MAKILTGSLNVLIDTGFWFALFEKGDQHHEEATAISDLLENHNSLIPWPSLYETLNTRFIKRPEWVDTFRSFIENPKTILVSDTSYKEIALQKVLIQNQKTSLVDIVISEMLMDRDLKIDYLITFNKKDFSAICAVRRIEIY